MDKKSVTMSRASQSQSTYSKCWEWEEQQSAKNFVILWVGQWEWEFVIDWLLLFFAVLLADFIALSIPKRWFEAFLLHYAIFYADPDPDLTQNSRQKNFFLNFWNWKWIFKRQQKNFWALIGILPISVLCFQFILQFFFLHFHRNSKNSKLVSLIHHPLKLWIPIKL